MLLCSKILDERRREPLVWVWAIMCEEAVVAVEERLSVQEVLVWLGVPLVEQFAELLVGSVVSNVDDCQNGRLGFSQSVDVSITSFCVLFVGDL
ncbi:hypothetical protein TELCIR_16514 [Teladorsagia circumcincta]|uniref:Uncharacterized protein n=1 Tax=Teladorsagia circumcincta TaxID=45464 RepID=A0A2G9TVJ4_TELCI|nr:hypothetical protein TELCIR_16514 [Teladorsagia circumcincta]